MPLQCNDQKSVKVMLGRIWTRGVAFCDEFFFFFLNIPMNVQEINV